MDGADDYTWRAVHTVGDRPSPREGHAAQLLAGRYLVVHGGYSVHSGYFNDTYVLDTVPDPMVWSRPVLTGPRPNSRHGHALLRLPGEELLLMGGFTDFGHRGDIHVLQLGVGNEIYYPDLPSYRSK